MGKIVKAALAVIVIFVLVLGFNTLRFRSTGILDIPGAEDAGLDEKSVTKRLAKGLTFRTISYSDRTKMDSSAFESFHDYLNESYPLVHEKLSLKKINNLSLLYQWPGSQPDLKPILLLAHLDVVPVPKETLSRWIKPPFGGEVADNKIWGRGALDIKSGVLGVLEAVETLLKSDFSPKRTVYIGFGHDEEVGGEEGAAKIAAHLKSQGVRFEYILDEGGSVVENGVIPGLKTPVALVGIAEKGYVSLKLSVASPGGHSSMPEKHTAVGVIAKAITRLEENPFPPNMAFSKLMFSKIGPKMPGAKKVVFANWWLTEPLVENILSKSNTTNATIRTTTAATMVTGSPKDNILPNLATAVINFRIMPGDTVESVKAYVKKVIDNPDIKMEIYADSAPPSDVSKYRNKPFKIIETTIHQILKNPELVVTPYIVVGGTDAKHYTGMSDSIYRFAYNRFTPESLKLMHGINEHVSIPEYLDNIRFFYCLIKNSDARL